MGAASHLGIDLRDYDTRIRTFIPGYDQMLEIASAALAATVPARSPLIVDLGTGTGALAASCRKAKPRARVVGVDEDEGMLAAAAKRLRHRFTGRCGSFEALDLPECDAVTACLALHHIPTPARRLRLFRRVHRALHREGVLVIADCYLSSDSRLRAADRAYWLAHLERRYTPAQARGYLRAWAKDDHYAPLRSDAPLRSEIGHLERAGFAVDVSARRGPFAVVVATK
jgi:ubiquinone/menaquinone biosynthesis C-methylase UbiE